MCYRFEYRILFIFIVEKKKILKKSFSFTTGVDNTISASLSSSKSSKLFSDLGDEFIYRCYSPCSKANFAAVRLSTWVFLSQRFQIAIAFIYNLTFNYYMNKYVRFEAHCNKMFIETRLTNGSLF